MKSRNEIEKEQARLAEQDVTGMPDRNSGNDDDVDDLAKSRKFERKDKDVPETLRED
ncbi:MAG: hypothetical protein ACQUHE_16355 [Bacteroidia bacterium]